LAVTSADSISQQDSPPGNEELDAVRRHICQVLGFDFGLIDLVRGHEVVSYTSFSAEPADEKADVLSTMEDEHQQPLTVAHTLVAQKVKQTQTPWVGRAYAKGGPADGYPYVIIPILDDSTEGSSQVKGLLRVVSLDESREVDEKDISTLKIIGQHLAGRLPDASAVAGEVELGEPGAVLTEAESVLVVHSNRPVRRRLTKILSGRYQVLEADSGVKTIDTLERSQIDLIILDCEVQGTSGYALCKVLKESPQWKHIPVILIAAESNVQGKIEGLNAGADDCLSENCHEAELLARAKASLRLRKTERDLAMQWQLLEDYAQRLEQAFEAERQANLKVSKHNQSLEQLNRELQQSKLKEQVLSGQEQLLRRITDIIRHSFHIEENIGKMLEELAGHFNLDCCFVILPSDDEPEDAVRSEYSVDGSYSVKGRDLDVGILNVFAANFSANQPVIISDVARERMVEPFKREVLVDYPVRSLFYMPVTYEEKLLGILGGHKCESETLWTAENKSFLRSVAGQVAIGVTNARLYARVQRQATTDGLTGLYNHRTGQEKLTEQLRMAERYQRNVAVVMIDVDHFKQINDTYGHPAGDTVLKSVARQIRNDCRDVDIPVRYGGEEFLLILPEVNQEGAVVVAERIRKNLARMPIIHEDIEINVSASIGVAAYPEDAGSQQQLLELADRALYMSKRLGRNQVHTAGDLMFSELKAQTAHPPEPAPQAVLAEKAETPEKQAQVTPVVEPEKEREELVPEVVDMVKALATALYSKSDYYKSHHLETARFAELVAKIMGLSQQQVEQLRVASLLHDVGVLSIPEDIIGKEGLVTPEEMEVIAQHPSLGAQMLRPIRALKDICDIVECHHECWDGTGYPRGLKGEEIPLPARILSIVDAFHAMISDRPYRPAMSREQAKKALRNGAGTQWDPFLVDIFLAVIDSLEQDEDAFAGP
jgi:diguanylate cyclase (GGDEF)-like protein/putative nucleotidyltransferase with HDIG domain